jgi:hypothetical protein
MMPCTNPTDEAAPVRLVLARRADTIADRQTPPCTLSVGEGRGWPVGWLVDEPAQQHGHDEEFGPLLAAVARAFICLALCDNVRRDRGAVVAR